MSRSRATADHIVVPRPTGRFSHQDRALPQLVIPELLYNALIAALSMAASYHFFTLIIEWWKSRGSSANNS